MKPNIRRRERNRNRSAMPVRRTPESRTGQGHPLWAEMFATSGRREQKMKVWFYEHRGELGWQPAGSLAWTGNRWQAEGAGWVALDALRARKLRDHEGVLNEHQPRRVLEAMRFIYEGPPEPALEHWHNSL